MADSITISSSDAALLKKLQLEDLLTKRIMSQGRWVNRVQLMSKGQVDVILKCNSSGDLWTAILVGYNMDGQDPQRELDVGGSYKSRKDALQGLLDVLQECSSLTTKLKNSAKIWSQNASEDVYDEEE